MPTYRITAPDGKTLRVEAPEGATQEQVLAFVQQNYKPSTYNAEEENKKFDPVTDMSTPERVLAGIGKGMTDYGRGVGQWLGLVSRDDVAEARRLDAPLTNTTAGAVGSFIGTAAPVALTAMIPGANTVGGAASIGALAGAAMPSESTTETLANIGIGGIAGAGGQKLANKVGQFVSAPQKPALTQGQQQALQAGKAVGMRPTPGQASGSKTLQKFEAALEANPMTSRGFDAIREQNSRALGRAAAKAIGEQGDELSAPVLQAAEQRLGSVFQSVADKTPVPLNTQSTKLAQLIQDTEGLIGGNASLMDNQLVQRLSDFMSRPDVTREQLRGLSSKMGKAAKNAMTSQAGDRELGKALFQAKELVDDAVEQSLPAAQRAAFAEARGQYRNLMSLLARHNIVNPSSGDISGRNLANALMAKDRGGFTMGRNTSDLYNAARFYQAFPSVVGNSGTATRSLGPADYLASLPTAMLTKAYLSEPVVAAAQGAAGGAGTLARLIAPPVGVAARPVVSVPGALTLAELMKQ